MEVTTQYSTMLIIPFIIFLISIYKIISTNSNKKILPSPPKLPILGNLHQIGWYPHRSFRKMSQKYGDLMLIHIGQCPYLIVSSKKAAQEILKSHDVDFSDRPTSEKIEKLFYGSKDVGTSQYGEYWRQLKSICVLNLLNTKMVAAFRCVREDEIAVLMDNILRKSLNISVPLDISQILSTYTQNVTCRIVFGKKHDDGIFRGENNNDVDFKMLWNEFTKMIVAFRIGDYVPSLSWTKKFDGWNPKMERVIKEFDGFLEQVLMEHQNQKDKEDGFTDFVTVLLRAQQQQIAAGVSFGRDTIKAVLLDMFSGGTDTSSTLLEWIMAELLRHPNVMEELKKEVRGIVGLKSKVNEDDLIQMKYLKAVIKETLRLHPPVYLIGRRSKKNVSINGYDIPRGIGVFINNWAIQRDSDYWDEPDKFNPNRFIDSSIDYLRNDCEYTPFGAGRRMCPGKSFAMAINELVVANLVHKFDWILPSGSHCETLDMTDSIGIVMRKKTPLLAIPKLIINTNSNEIK